MASRPAPTPEVPVELGGDPPCWEGLVEDHRDEAAGAARGSAADGDLDTPTKVHDLVIAFYREVVFDPLLGPVFEEDAEVDWSTHIPHLIDYWCWILFGTKGYAGNVTRTHRQLHRISPMGAVHCDRWLELWRGCVDARWAGPFAQRAERHGATIMAGLAKHVFGVDWRPPDAA